MSTEPEVVKIPDWRIALEQAIAQLPAHVEIPYELTEEGQRWRRFRNICPEEFLPKIDRARLPKPAQFDAVANWDGNFPGPLAWGPTDTAKSRAQWYALRVQFVKHNRTFAWFPVKKLVAELESADRVGQAHEFYRQYAFYRILMVDDLDKINWRDENQMSILFDFYDKIYRDKTRLLATTNKDKDWWTERMGDAFARRLFKDCHTAVQF